MVVSGTRRQNNRRGRRSIPVRAAQAMHDKEVKLLTDIKDLNLTQANGAVPVIPDVEYPILKRRKVYTFERSNQATTIVVQGTTPVDLFGALAFSLNQFPDFTEFTSLFDQYRISTIQLEFVPTTGQNTGSPILTAIDYDDSTPVTSVGALLEYNTLMITSPGQFFQRTFNPKVSVATYQGIATTAYSSMGGIWIDAGYPAVQYYGLKYAAPFIAGVNYQVNVYVKAVIQCRNTR